MNNIIEEIKKIFDDIISIECCSRLLHKNIVFKVETKKGLYTVKVYLYGDDKDFRIDNELKFYLYFNDNNIVNVPNIYNIIKTNNINCLVMEWINGSSLKKIIKNNSDASEYINKMLCDLEKIWSITNLDLKKNLIIDQVGLDKRLGFTDDEILSYIKNNRNNIDFDNIFDIYKHLKNKITIDKNHIINSDISVHECIFVNDNSYWIDFERFRLGDPNNDLARCFQSLTNGIYNNNELFKEIYKLFKSNKFYNEEAFIYYLVEKLLSTIYTANNQIEDDEINFYIEFIDNIYNKNNCLKKQRLK